MKKLLYPISMILIGVVLTLLSLFILMAFDRVIPAGKEYQQECPKMTDAKVRTSLIKSWLRTAAEGEEMDSIGLSSIWFETHPTFSDNSWSGELKVFVD